jgi:CCR4-NOT transcription complex subunit 6
VVGRQPNCIIFMVFELWFFAADSLSVESLLELVDEDSLRKDTALPSPEWSSDHIALLAEFRCNPRLRR